MLLHTPATSCSDFAFHAMIDAGPGTAKDRTNTLNRVGSKGPAVPVHQIYVRLQRWRFEMVRPTSLGVVPPDPTVQMNLRTPFVQTLADEHVNIKYRANAFLMAKNRCEAVTQEQVADRWAYIVAEARAFHGAGPKESGKKAASCAPGSSRSDRTGRRRPSR